MSQHFPRNRKNEQNRRKNVHKRSILTLSNNNYNNIIIIKPLLVTIYSLEFTKNFSISLVVSQLIR